MGVAEFWVWVMCRPTLDRVAPTYRLHLDEMNGKGGSCFAASCLPRDGLFFLCNARHATPSLPLTRLTVYWNLFKIWTEIKVAPLSWKCPLFYPSNENVSKTIVQFIFRRKIMLHFVWSLIEMVNTIDCFPSVHL